MAIIACYIVLYTRGRWSHPTKWLFNPQTPALEFWVGSSYPPPRALSYSATLAGSALGFCVAEFISLNLGSSNFCPIFYAAKIMQLSNVSNVLLFK